jgi:hypothetical protein
VVTLADAASMVPFHLWWQATVDVLGPDALAPDDYPHHRFGDPSPLVDQAQQCGWSPQGLELIDTVRTVDHDTLWAWLSGSLPIRRADGSDIAPVERARLEPALHESLMARAEPWRRADTYALPIAAWLLSFTTGC